MTTQKSSLIPACVDLGEIEYPIEYSEPWDVDTRPGGGGFASMGGRILRHRGAVLFLVAEIFGDAR